MITILGYSSIQILIIVASSIFTGLGIGIGFDIWKKIKSKWNNRKNKNYINNFEKENLAASVT